MDAKSKANFINSVASGATIPCPKCGTANNSDSSLCVSCGAEINASQAAQNSAPAFAQIKETEQSIKASKYVEPNNVFADGLPEWNIEPPQITVRRH